MKYTENLIKIGRTETVIFEGDTVINIPELNYIHFATNENRRLSTVEERKEFHDWAKEKFPDNKVTYYVGMTQKISQSFFKDWKRRLDVNKIESTSPNGNKVIKYVYTP